jgi:hypothetical protein
MKRRRHRQRQRALGTLCLEHLAGALHRRLAAGNHGLAGSLKLAASTTSALPGWPKPPASPQRTWRSPSAASMPSTAAIAPGAHRHGVLHRLRTKTHQRRRLPPASVTPAGNQRRILTQRMAGHHLRRQPDFGHPDPVGRHAGHQHHRLGVGGQCQRLLGALLDQCTNVFVSAHRKPLPRPARPRDGHPRRRACPPTASPAPEIQKQMVSWSSNLVPQDKLASSAYPDRRLQSYRT